VKAKAATVAVQREPITESDLRVTTWRPAPGPRLVLAVVATLVALGLVAALVVALPAPRTKLLAALMAPSHITQADVPLAPYVAALLAAAILGFVLTYHTLRVAMLVYAWRTFMARLGDDLAARLGARAPLSALGYIPSARGPRAGTSGNPAREPLAAVLPLFPRVVLVGDDGAGKSIALWRFALDVARHISTGRILAGRQVIPILVSLPAYAQADPAPGGVRVAFLAQTLRGYGAEMLARYLPSLLRRGRVLLLCDGLDELAPSQMDTIGQELLVTLPQRLRSVRVVLTCRAAALAPLSERLPALAQCPQVTLLPMSNDEVRTLLQRADRAGQLGGEPTESVIAEIDRRAAWPVYRRPATLAMLIELLAAGNFIPSTRAQLLDEYEEMLFARAGIVDARLERVRRALGYLAVTFRLTGQAEITGAQVWNEREAIHNLLSDSSSSAKTLGGTTRPITFNEKDLNEAIDLGLTAGILERGANGVGLRFSHALLLQLAAARHLDLNDAGLGRVGAALLRPEWSEIVILWGGLTADPAGLTERLVRLAATPSGTAATAHLSDLARGAAEALALALTVAVVSLAPVAVGAPAGPTGGQSRADWAQHTLREVCDRVLRYGTEAPEGAPERRAHLRQALRQCATSAAGEFEAALARLVRLTGVQRLLRAQAVQILGLVASSAGLNELTALLLEPDPIVREALQRGFHLAGDEAADPLLDLLGRSAPTEALHRRAMDALIAIDGPAVTPALAYLDDPLAARRAAAAEALGALRAHVAREPLMRALRDADPAVRLAATRALGKLGDPKAQPALLHLLHAPGDDARIAAIEALGALRGEDALNPLIALLDDKSARVRAAAAEALGHIGDARAVAPLRQRLADKDAWTQAAAATALRALGQRT
jgi:HEAT repeat protein